MSATQAIIHFVGLCLFSASVPNDPGVHAILPAVSSGSGWHEHTERFDATAFAQKATPGRPAPAVPGPEKLRIAQLEGSGIEDHVSMIVFPTSIIDNDAQWKAGPIPNAKASLSGYSQVTLNGEHVTFLANGVNAPAAIPLHMPRFSCSSRGTLTAAYQWPYTGAQAVVDIPEGQLAACSPGAIAPGRVDTKLTLNTTGKLTIVAMKQGVAKTLILKTDQAPRIYVINVPARWAAGDHTAESLGVSHYVAYYTMIGKNKNSGCSGAPKLAHGQSIASCAGSAFIPPDPGGSGGTPATMRNAMLISRGAAGRPPQIAMAGQPDPVMESMMANSECSNSAWP